MSREELLPSLLGLPHSSMQGLLRYCVSSRKDPLPILTILYRCIKETDLKEYGFDVDELIDFTDECEQSCEFYDIMPVMKRDLHCRE